MRLGSIHSGFERCGFFSLSSVLGINVFFISIPDGWKLIPLTENPAPFGCDILSKDE
jgi:hypothetical protein